MPGMLWGKIKRSPHAHARIVSIDARKALKLPGVQGGGHRRRFPGHPVGGGVRRRRADELPRPVAQLHGARQGAVRRPRGRRGRRDLAGDRRRGARPDRREVRGAAATSSTSRRRWRPMRRSCTTTCSPRTSSRSRPSRRTSPSGCTSTRAMSRPASSEAEVIVEGRYTTEPVHQAYIEPHACLCSYGADGQCTIFSSQPGPVHGARPTGQAAGDRHRQHPRHPGRDRRRVRRQDAGLSGAAGARAVEEDRPAGQDADDARGGVPRLRPDLGRHRWR